MPSLQFISIDASAREGILSEVMRAVKEDMNVDAAHRALIGALRQAFPSYCYAEISVAGLESGQYRLSAVWREDGSEVGTEHSPWRIAGVPVRSGGVIAEIVARGTASMVLDLSVPSGDPAFRELGEYCTVVATPGGLGEPENWTLVLSRRPGEFDLDTLEKLAARGALIGSTLKSLQAAQELRRAKAFIDAEMDQIAAIQRALLPSQAPVVPGLDIAAWSATFDRVGGDFYEYADLRQERWAVIIADASGHGPAAAVVAAMLNAILHAYGAHQRDRVSVPGPGEVLDFANAQLAEKQIEQSFVTAFLGMWDPAAGTFTYARAGHNPPFLLKASGEMMQLDVVGDLPLAILPETRYEQHVQPLSRGDLLLLYTDGIVDASDASNQPFGEGRLQAALRAAAGSAADILASLREAVSRHMCGERSRDDQTLVVLRAT